MAHEIGVKAHYLDLDVLMERAVALVPDLTSPACGMAPEGGEWHTVGGFRIHRGVSMRTVHSLAWLLVVGCLSLVAGPAVAGLPTLDDSAETFLKYAGHNEKKATKALLVLLKGNGATGEADTGCEKHPGLVSELLKRGADPNRLDVSWEEKPPHFSYRALGYLALNSSCTAAEIELLMEHGQEPFRRQEYRWGYPDSSDNLHHLADAIGLDILAGTATANKLVAFIDATQVKVNLRVRLCAFNDGVRFKAWDPVVVVDEANCSQAYEAFVRLYDRGIPMGETWHDYLGDNHLYNAAWYADAERVGQMLEDRKGHYCDEVNDCWDVLKIAYNAPTGDRLATLRKFLEARTVRSRWHSGMIDLLERAIRDGDDEVALLALEYAGEKDREQALNTAIEVDSAEWIARLAEGGVRDEEPLAIAISQRRPDHVQVLLDSGIKAGAQSFSAVATLDPFDDEAKAMLQAMVDKGGDINAYHQRKTSNRPIDHHKDLRTRSMDTLLDHLAYRFRTDTALHRGVSSEPAVMDWEGMKALLELGADPNLRDYSQRTVLTRLLQQPPSAARDRLQALLEEHGALQTPPAELQAWRDDLAAKLRERHQEWVAGRARKEARQAEEQRREEEERLAKERRADEERQARAQQQAEWAQQNAANSVDVMGVIEGVFSEQLQPAPTYQPVVVSPGTSATPSSSTPSSSTPSSSTPSSSSSSTSSSSPTVRPEDCMVFPKTDHCNDQLDLEDDACRSQHPKDGTLVRSTRYASCFDQATKRHSSCVRQAEADAKARLPPECTSRPGASGAASTTEQ